MRNFLWIGLFEALGVAILLWGMPRARRHMSPRRWRLGIAALGLSLMVWPPLCDRYAEDINGILLLFAMMFSFLWGVHQLREADATHLLDAHEDS